MLRGPLACRARSSLLYSAASETSSTAPGKRLDHAFVSSSDPGWQTFAGQLVGTGVRLSSENELKLPPTVLFKESKHIVRPNRGAEVTKHMAVVARFSVRRIDLQLVWLARILHRGRKRLARR